LGSCQMNRMAYIMHMIIHTSTPNARRELRLEAGATQERTL
jgi:hypothetical protein